MKNSILLPIIIFSLGFIYSCKQEVRTDAPTEKREPGHTKGRSTECAPTGDNSVEQTATSLPNENSDAATTDAETAAIKKAENSCKGTCDPTSQKCAFFRQGIKTVTTTTQTTVNGQVITRYTATSTVSGKCGCE